MEWQVSLPPHIHAFRSDLAASQLVASENSLVRSEAVSRIYTLVGDLPRLLSPAGERPRSTAAPGPTGSPLHRSCRHHQPAYRFSIAVAIPITSLPISPPPGVTLQAYPLTFKHILSLQAYPPLTSRPKAGPTDSAGTPGNNNTLLHSGLCSSAFEVDQAMTKLRRT